MCIVLPLLLQWYSRIMSTQLTEVSKFLSYVLRHKPEAIGIKLDREGWVAIEDLVKSANVAGQSIDEALVHQLAETSAKKRFTISSDGYHIRAAQGHSTNSVEIDFPESVPPEILYHGTATRVVESIRQHGLRAGKRHYVHLSSDPRIALEVGERHGKAVVLKVCAKKMHQHGLKLYQAENGVWLTAFVSPEYLEL
jgi:putative RNA 2'-phosphotransferase